MLDDKMYRVHTKTSAETPSTKDESVPYSSQSGSGKNNRSVNKVWSSSGEKDSTENVEESTDAVDISKELRPLLTAMTVAGLYFPPSDPAKSWVARLLNWRRLYCLAVNTIAWWDVLRITFPLLLGTVSPSLFIQCLIQEIWFLQCAMAISTWFYLCAASPRTFPALIDLLRQVCCSSVSDDQGRAAVCLVFVGRRWLRRRVISCIAFPVVLALFTAGSIGFAVCGPVEAVRNETAFLLVPVGLNGCAPVFATFFVSATAFYGTVCVFALFCWIISQLYRSLNNAFKNCISLSGKLGRSIRDIREQHQRVSKAVHLADELFSFFLGVSVLTLLGQIFFLLHQLFVARNEFGPVTIVCFAWWLLVCSSFSVVIWWFAASLHNQAHDAVNYIHDISQWTNADDESSIHVTLFLAKLNGAPIALTTWGFVPITKDFALTVLGFMLAYFTIFSQTLSTSGG